jgi:thimet oligopeptidase
LTGLASAAATRTSGDAAVTASGAYSKDMVAPRGASSAAVEFAAAERRRFASAEASLARVLAVRGKRTVANTLVPFNDLLMQLDEASGRAGLFEETHPDSTMRDVATLADQIVSRFATDLALNRKLYDAISALNVSRQPADTRYFMMKTIRDFRRSGVDRDKATREKVRKLNAEIVRVGQNFDRAIAEDTRSVQVPPAALAGLPEDYIAAHAPGADGRVTITTDYPDYFPAMTYATNDSLRHDLYVQFLNRAYPQNNATLDTLLDLRYDLARTLGFPNYAAFITADKMVGSDSAASSFIDRVVQASGKRAADDYATLLARKKKDQPSATVVMPWEKFYYQEKVQSEQYAFSSQSVRPYFPFDQVKKGVLDTASKLFGVTFQRVEGVPLWHPSVEAYDLLSNGKKIGRFYLDLHPRANKYKHAAHFGIARGVRGKRLPESALVCNFPGGKPGDPGLMEHDDVVTFFHEFGHLLHSIFAGRQQWVENSGTSTEHDFVEAPSQMLEEWAWQPSVLRTFARNAQGEVIPDTLIARMRAADEFGKGLTVRQQMFYARLSLDIYDRDPHGLDVDEKTQEIQTAYTPFPFVEGTHMAASFGHLNGYSATYYTYMWSLVIAKDMFSAFPKDNLFGSPVSARYRDEVLASGGSAPAATLVSRFLGRQYNTNAFEEWLNKK